MAISNKPLVWGLFAAGGTLAAFVLPVLVLIVLLAGYGLTGDLLSYASMQALLSNWLVKAAVFLVISLCLWHTAHRLRDALHGLGLRADGTVAVVGYGVAALGTILTVYYLFQI